MSAKCEREENLTLWRQRREKGKVHERKARDEKIGMLTATDSDAASGLQRNRTKEFLSHASWKMFFLFG